VEALFILGCCGDHGVVCCGVVSRRYYMLWHHACYDVEELPYDLLADFR
jgi:hypothetical protein